MKYGCCGHWDECKNLGYCSYLKSKKFFQTWEDAIESAKGCLHYPYGFGSAWNDIPRKPSKISSKWQTLKIQNYLEL